MNQTFYYDRHPHVGMKILKWTGIILGGIALAILLAFIFGYFVMLLWNWLMPALFGLPEIDFWMAFGIIILSKILFGGIGNNHSHSKQKSKWHHDHIRKGRYSSCYPGSLNWEHYDDFWKEEGEEAFKLYTERKKNRVSDENRGSSE